MDNFFERRYDVRFIPVITCLFEKNHIKLYYIIDYRANCKIDQFYFDNRDNPLQQLRGTCCKLVGNIRKCNQPIYTFYATIFDGYPIYNLCTQHHQIECDNLGYYRGYSQTLNQICDQLGIPRLHREKHLLPAHIREFIGMPFLPIERMESILFVNCSRADRKALLSLNDIQLPLICVSIPFVSCEIARKKARIVDNLRFESGTLRIIDIEDDEEKVY